jgi:hypothetical protein
MPDRRRPLNLVDRALGLRPGEHRRVAALFAASFTLGLALVLFDLAVGADLLAVAAPDELPWARVAVGAAVLVSGLALVTLQHRLSPAAFVAGPLLGLAVTGLAAVHNLAEAPGFYALLGLYAAQRVLSAFALVAYWTVAADALDVAESRRLYALGSAGELLAVLAVGLAAGPLRHALALPHLLDLSLVLLVAGAALLLPLARRTRAVRPTTSSPTAAATRDEHRHAASCLAYHVAYNATCILVEFTALIAVARANPGRPDAIAGLLGALIVARVAVAAAARLFIAGRVLDRLGPGPGLACGPVVVLTVGAVALLSGTATHAPLTAAVALSTAEAAARHALGKSAFMVAQRPLPPTLQTRTLVATETLAAPLTAGLVGGLLLLAPGTWLSGPVLLVIPCCTALAWLLAARALTRSYLRLVPGSP